MTSADDRISLNISSDNESTIAELPQSTKFWISDGNTILHTNTQRYRVHQSMLCRHSTVFRAVLIGNNYVLPAGNADPDSPGCRHVSVQGSDTDWDTLLSIFYDARSFREESSGLISFDTLQALLRLGHLYGFAQRNDALKQLKEVLPCTLQAWDNLLASADLKKQELRKFGKAHAFGLLCIAQELNIKRCLPVAYLNCLRYRKSSQVLYGRDRSARHDSSLTLPATAQVKLLVGKEKIRNELFTYPLSWWHAGSRSQLCRAKNKCSKAIRAVLQAYRLEKHVFCSALDPFRGGRLGGLCGSCAPEAIAAYNSGRAKIFDELPSFFCGVPGWDDLEDEFD